MKLYLSSHLIGNTPQDLTELIGKNKRVALIMNAADPYGDERRPEYREKFKSEFSKLGLLAEEIDLRVFFGASSKLKEVLENYGLLWVSGGNTFSLRWTMSKSGFDKILPDLINNNDIVYGGFSAGACVLSPSLQGLHLVDAPEKVPSAELQWVGLGIIDFCIAPHYRSEHAESAAIENVVKYYEKNGIKYRTLRDGEALRIIDGNIESVGFWSPKIAK